MLLLALGLFTLAWRLLFGGPTPNDDDDQGGGWPTLDTAHDFRLAA
jgi:hypothetical protein